MIKQISWDDILRVWQIDLWPDRTTPIEPNSAMVFLGGYDLYNMNTMPTFFGLYENNELAGVNSGHMCNHNQYRSRGLFVYPKYRGKNYGTMLLLATVDQAKSENAEMIWSLPRFTSIKTYQRAGFKVASEWFSTDTSDLNSYVVNDLGN